MKTATETKTDDDADRSLKRRHGMRLVLRDEPYKPTERVRIGIADDVFTNKPKTAQSQLSAPGAEAPTDFGRGGAGKSHKIANVGLSTVAVAAAIGLVVGLLLAKEER